LRSYLIIAWRNTLQVITSPASAVRPGTPLPSGDTPSAEVIAAEESVVRQYATAIIDIRALQSSVLALWREEVSMMIPDLGDDNVGIVQLEGMCVIRSTSLFWMLSIMYC